MANAGMTILIASASGSQTENVQDKADRSVCPAILRGAHHKCPACGDGRIYSSYLKVADECAHCGTELHHHRADDAPPYVTIFVVGHMILFGVMTLEKAYAPEAWVHALIWVPLTLVLSLTLLPKVKGAFIGLQWALRMHGFGSGPDPAQPDEIEPDASQS